MSDTDLAITLLSCFGLLMIAACALVWWANRIDE